MKDFFKELKNHLLTGVSYMIPMVTVGGICIAFALATGTAGANGMEVTSPFWNNILTIGVAAFGLMVPVLAGYIAYSIAGRPGLAPGLVCGYLANNPIGESGVKTGFLGGIILGVAAGLLANWIKKWKVHRYIKPVMPILIIPIISAVVVGLVYIYLLAAPLGGAVGGLESWLSSLTGGSVVLLGIAIGCMVLLGIAIGCNCLRYGWSGKQSGIRYRSRPGCFRQYQRYGYDRRCHMRSSDWNGNCIDFVEEKIQ